MKRQSFLKGVVLLTAAGIIVKLIGFVYRVVLTNLPGYGDEGNGIYGAGFQVYLVLYAISTTGFPSAISKLVAEKTAVGDSRGAHRTFKVAFWMLFISGGVVSLIFFLGAGFIAELISSPRTFYTMLALAPTIFFVSIMAAYRGYFQGMQDMSPQANSQIVEQLGKTVITIIFAYLLLPYGVEITAAGATLGTTLGAAAGAAYLWNLYNRRKKELWAGIGSIRTGRKQESTARIIKDIVKISVPITIGALILTAANIVDLGTVMRQLPKAGFDEETANRLYGILTGKCNVLTHFPVAVSMALSTSLVPAVAAAVSARDYRSAAQKISASLRLSVLIGLPSSVGLAILAEPILKMIFPGSSEGAYLLAISAFSVVFMGLTQTLAGVLQGLGKGFIPAAALLVGALFKIILNYTLLPLPHVNIRGAAYGTLACYAVSTIICITGLKLNFRLKLNVYNFIIKPAAAAVVMGVSVFYIYNYLHAVFPGNLIAPAVAILAGIGIFGAVLLLLGAVGIKDISVLPFGKNIGRALERAKIIR